MSPLVLTPWGWTWRLTVRCVATLVISAVGVLGIGAGIASGHMDWFEFLAWASGWTYSVLLTGGIAVAFVRRPNTAGLKRK